MVKRILALFWLWPLVSPAAQVIQSASIADVAQHLEFRSTYNPSTGNLYAWTRYLQPSWGSNWRYCWLYYIQPNAMSQTGAFPLSTVLNGTGVSSVVNPKGGWFISNGINFDQEGMDWCSG